MVSLQALALVCALSGGGETVLLDFYSDTCGPCRQMAPVVSQMAAAGYVVRQVNVDRERELAGRFGITRIPCFVMVVNGRETDRLLGLTTAARLEGMYKLAVAKHPAPSESQGPPVQLASHNTTGPTIPVPAVKSDSSFAIGAPAAATADATQPGWRMSEPAAAAPATAAGPADGELIASTVRLRIEDPKGWSCGTGTIIDARDGEALILTCGHIFRDSQGKGRVQVDLFGPQAPKGIAGQVISYDADRLDVGLVSVRVSGPVRVARVAPPGYQVNKGDAVTNVGCNNGDDPTVRHSHVTALDKFGGAPNVEVAGLPVQGRSGGGLFSRDGYVIGVCNAADPADNEGLYAALGSIHAQLNGARLPEIYQPSPSTLASAAPASPSLPRQMPQPGNLVQLTGAPAQPPMNLPAPPLVPTAGNQPMAAAAPTAPAGLSVEEQAALEEIRRRSGEGAEVICVIRSRTNPDARSEIVVVDKASPAFLQQLTGRDRTAATAAPNPATAPTAAAPSPASAPNWQANWNDTLRR